MDNANEISADFTHKEVALFLGDELKSQNDESIVTYDLVEEYAKTAKHHKPFVWGLLALCFFVVGAGTFTTIGIVTHSNHKIAINIDSFDDLNLRSLLNSAGRVQTLYDNAVKNKQTLEQNLADELAQAEQKREMDLFTLQSVASVLEKNSLSDRKIKIALDYNTAVQQIQSAYAPRLAEAEEEIKKYKAQVDSYDSTKLSEAQGAEASIDSTKQLHDIEMRSQQERYEAKIRELRQQLLAQQLKAAEDQRTAVEEVRGIYQAKIDLLDPKAREQSPDQDKIIFEAGIKSQTENSTLWQSVENLRFSGTDYVNALSSSPFAESVRRVQRELNGLRTIAYRFKPIPMENSIKDYVPAMIHQSYQIAGDLAETGAKMQKELDDFALVLENTLSVDSDGVILNASEAPRFSVYVAARSRYKISEENPVPVQIFNAAMQTADGTILKSGEDFFVTQTVLPASEGASAAPAYTPAAGDRFRLVLPQ